MTSKDQSAHHNIMKILLFLLGAIGGLSVSKSFYALDPERAVDSVWFFIGGTILGAMLFHALYDYLAKFRREHERLDMLLKKVEVFLKNFRPYAYYYFYGLIPSLIIGLLLQDYLN